LPSLFLVYREFGREIAGILRETPPEISGIVSYYCTTPPEISGLPRKYREKWVRVFPGEQVMARLARLLYCAWFSKWRRQNEYPMLKPRFRGVFTANWGGV